MKHSLSLPYDEGVRPEDLLAHHVVPIAVCERVGRGYRVEAIVGTAFTFGEGTVVTCWHCVRQPLANHQTYGVATREDGVYATSYSHISPIVTLTQDENGSDVAIGRVEIRESQRLSLASQPPGWGQDVTAIGYPLSLAIGVATDHPHFRTGARLLRGYVTRIIQNDQAGTRKAIRSYEIDMPAPPGMSGAPLLNSDMEVCGLIDGRLDDMEPSDPTRSYTFASAQHLSVLEGAVCPATNGLPLREHLG